MESEPAGGPPSTLGRAIGPPKFPVHGTLFESTGPGPAVVLTGGSWGSELRNVGRWLAREGFPALSLAYFGREGLSVSLRDVPLEYFRDAATTVSSGTGSEKRPSVLLGVSRGSEAALLTAVHFPLAVAGVIAVVPSNLAVGSWPPGGPAWRLGGEPLPYASRFGPYTLEPGAEIEVERIRAPLLLLSAGADQTWPSSAMARAIVTRAGRKGGGPKVQHIDYPDATHALGQLVSESDFAPGPPSWPADEVARAGARESILAFLRSLR